MITNVQKLWLIFCSTSIQIWGQSICCNTVIMKRSVRKKAEIESKGAAAESSESKTTDSGNLTLDVPPKRKRSKKKADFGSNDSVTSPYFENSSSTATSQKQPGEKLDRSFYDQDTISLAKALLGKVLCRKLPSSDIILKGTIVETEAYPGVGDAASHSFKGVPTPSSMAMFMDPGTAYVYMTYGMYYCFNVSSKDNGGACLLRGAEVLEDYEIMHTLRQSKKKQVTENPKPAKRLKQHELANGPSKLCLAFDINRSSCDKTDMTISEDLWLEESLDPKYHLRQFVISESRRVGIDSTPPEARNQLYRFFIDENSSVSKVKFKEEKKQASRTTSRSRSKK